MIDFSTLTYVPNLVIRTSERAAIMNIPNTTASLMLPIFTMVPVGKRGGAVLKRIQDMQGDLWARVVVEVGEDIDPNPGESPTNGHLFLRSLREENEDFRNWQDFIKANTNFIPTLLIPGNSTDSDRIQSQINRFEELQRGMVLKVRKHHTERNPNIIYVYRDIVTEIARRELQDQFLIVFDYGKIDNSELTQNWCSTTFDKVFAGTRPDRFQVSLCGTNFPNAFDGLKTQIVRVEIQERTLFQNFIDQKQKSGATFYYGDYASTRGEFRQRGGAAPPRVDFATQTHWVYNRRKPEASFDEDDGTESERSEDRDEGFHHAAQALLSDEEVRSETERLQGLYGANMIQQAANDLDSVKASPVVWTGVRINLHLYQQSHRSGETPPSDLEEDFED